MPIAVLLGLLYTQAHVGDVLDTVGVAVDQVEPDRLNIEATYGHVVVDGQEARWACHETVIAPDVLVSPRYVQKSDGSWVAWTSTASEGRDGIAMWTSTDQCDWSPVADLPDALIIDVDTRGDTVWFGTGSQGSSNGLFRVTDHGVESAGDPTTDLLADLHTSGPAIWAVSTDGLALRVWHGVDHLELTLHSIALPDDLATPITGSIAWVDPVDPLHALLVADPSGPDLVLETTDGGATTTVFWQAPGGVSQLVRRADGTHLAILNDRRTYSDASGAWQDVDELADASSFVETSDGIWFANRTFVNGRLISRSRDSLTIDTSFQPAIITSPVTCPAESDSERICEPLWDALSARFDFTEPTDSIPPLPTPTSDPEDCGCQTNAPGRLGSSMFARRR